MAGTELERVQPISPIELIQSALISGTSPEVIRELVALQQSMERFQWEREERQAEQDFGDALSRCQAKIGLLKPNQGRKSKKADTHDSIFWLDYVGLDRDIRPIYIAEGFSISFSEVEEGKDGYVGMKALLSRGRITREYFKRLTLAAAFEGMPKADAEASAASRVKRYLMLQIFNVAVGIDLDEKKPFADQAESMDSDTFNVLSETMESMASKEDLRDAYYKAMAACGVTAADLDRADWLQKAKYKREAGAFVELKNKLLTELGRRK